MRARPDPSCHHERTSPSGAVVSRCSSALLSMAFDFPSSASAIWAPVWVAIGCKRLVRWRSV